jgi:hypothetical protein
MDYPIHNFIGHQVKEDPYAIPLGIPSQLIAEHGYAGNDSYLSFEHEETDVLYTEDRESGETQG